MFKLQTHYAQGERHALVTSADNIPARVSNVVIALDTYDTDKKLSAIEGMLKGGLFTDNKEAVNIYVVEVKDKVTSLIYDKHTYNCKKSDLLDKVAMCSVLCIPLENKDGYYIIVTEQDTDYVIYDAVTKERLLVGVNYSNGVI